MNPLIRAALKMAMLAGVMKGAEMMATRGADPNDPQTREAGRRARRNTAMTMRLLNTLRRTLKY